MKLSSTILYQKNTIGKVQRGNGFLVSEKAILTWTILHNQENHDFDTDRLKKKGTKIPLALTISSRNNTRSVYFFLFSFIKYPDDFKNFF